MAIADCRSSAKLGCPLQACGMVVADIRGGPQGGVERGSALLSLPLSRQRPGAGRVGGRPAPHLECGSSLPLCRSGGRAAALQDGNSESPQRTGGPFLRQGRRRPPLQCGNRKSRIQDWRLQIENPKPRIQNRQAKIANSRLQISSVLGCPSRTSEGGSGNTERRAAGRSQRGAPPCFLRLQFLPAADVHGSRCKIGGEQ